MVLHTARLRELFAEDKSGLLKPAFRVVAEAIKNVTDKDVLIGGMDRMGDVYISPAI